MLNNKTVFITGASSGIGEACAVSFAREGARLLLCARRVEKLQALAAQLRSAHGVDVHTLQLDVTQAESVSKSLQALPESWQKIEVLVNNAGLASGLDRLQEAKIDDWNAMIDTNIKGLLFVTKMVLPGMIARNSGHIINISSISGHRVYAGGVVYCATKHAVRALTEGLRMDVAGTKVRVSSVDPGFTKTEFSLVRFKGDVKRADAVYENIRALTADDVADGVVYCATRPPHVNISELIIMPTDQA